GAGVNIDPLAWASVAQLLASFLLDGLGIGLQRFDLPAVVVVLLLQSINLFLQVLIFGALLPVNHHAVGAKHNMKKQPARGARHSGSRKPPPSAIQPSERRA